MRKTTIWVAAAAVMCALPPPQVFAQSGGGLTGSANNTILQGGTQAGFLAGTMMVPQQRNIPQTPITVNIANDRRNGEQFEIVMPRRGGYGGGAVTPGISGYSNTYGINNPTYTSAIVKVHRFEPRLRNA
jgi:hypothetical protein